MNKKNYKFIYNLILAFFIACSFLTNVCSANVLTDWKDSRAYRPSPVLFLHGFASESPRFWTEAKVDEILNQLYSKYYTGYSSDPTILSSTRYPYLEIINFGSSLIDRNSSIDTYKAGDRYVLTGQRKAGDPGWSDKLNTAIETLRQYYINRDGSRQEIILIAHSMGGLAARKYLKSYSYANQKIDKLIMIGTPNLGSLLVATITTPYNRNRRWGWYLFPMGWVSLTSEVTVDKFLETFPKIDMHGDAVWDMDPTSTGSGFIRDLNYNYSTVVDHFAIAGRHWLAFNLGDTVASLDSQLGTGVLSLKDKSIINNAFHWKYPPITMTTIIKFLDSTKPELQITSPDPTQTTEITTAQINVKGKVYNEYLPADSKINITIARQEDGYTYSQNSFLKPSDLWIPNNLASPVAEFDEIVNFPGSGTYKISCQVKNPAGVASDIKDVWVKVTLQGSYIVVHCHNPEGKEIASIQEMDQNCIEVYDGDILIGHGAYNLATHNKPIAISAGTHTVKAKFNGITMEQNINIGAGETQVLTFIFTRTEISNTELFVFNTNLELTDQQYVVSDYAWSSKVVEGVHCLAYSYVYYDALVENYALVNASSTLNSYSANLYGYGKIIAGSGFLGWSVGAIADIDKIIDILPQTFTEWFVQQYSTQDADIGMSIRTQTEYFEILKANRGYYLTRLLANREYIRVGYPGVGFVYFLKHPFIIETGRFKSYQTSFMFSHLGADLKMSSVPYDLDGQAV